MKKLTRIYLLIIVLLLLFRIDSKAQFSIGVRGGVNVARIQVKDDIFSYTSKIGINVAFLANLPVNKIFSLQIEPGYSQYGAKYKEIMINNLTESRYDGHLATNYIELPILFQYKPKIGKIEGVFSLGPEVRMRAGYTEFTQTATYWQNDVFISDYFIKQSTKNTFRRIDYGLNAGIGIAYPLGGVKIFMEGRYHLGLRKLNPDWVTAYNRAFSFNLGFMVPLKR